MAHAEELFAVLAEAALYEFIDEEPPQSVEALRQKLALSESRCLLYTSPSPRDS